MSTSLVLSSLRCALRALPAQWALWSIDGEGVILVHEGPAAGEGERPAVGRSVWEVYRGEELLLAFAARVLREPASAELITGGRRMHLSGKPRAEGGAEGMALVLGSAPDQSGRSGPAAVSRVLELLRPVPEIGAEAGDLLLWNPGGPEVVGLYREVCSSRLPEEVVRDLRLTRSSGADAPARAAASPAGAARPLRERAAHLRVVS